MVPRIVAVCMVALESECLRDNDTAKLIASKELDIALNSFVADDGFTAYADRDAVVGAVVGGRRRGRRRDRRRGRRQRARRCRVGDATSTRLMGGGQRKVMSERVGEVSDERREASGVSERATEPHAPLAALLLQHVSVSLLTG